MITSRKRWICGGTALVSCAFALSASAALPGAIFTTNSDGSIVNGNTKYLAKCGTDGVWLDGGPGPNAPQDAAGLPDGDYYFQVTDPSGKKLLSTDPVANRLVTVVDGIITSANVHNTNPSQDAGVGVVVELCPFDDTPNNGGVYKAWMTPVGSFVGDPALVDNGYSPGNYHGFIPAASKTDNFKVTDVRTFCIVVTKLVRDDKGVDVPTAGWPILITDPQGVVGEFFTDDQGEALQCVLTPGFYTVEELLLEGFIVVETSVNGVVLAQPTTQVVVQLKNGLKEDTATVEFINEQKCPKEGCK